MKPPGPEMLASLGGVPWCLAGGVQHSTWLEAHQTSAVMLMWLSALGGHSIVKWEGGVDVDVLQVAEILGWVDPPVWTGRGPLIGMKGSQAGSPSVFMPWTSAPDREISTGSKPPFNPSGYTTWFPPCNNWHISSWQRWSHTFLLAVPLIMALRCPSLGRGTMLGILIELHKSVGPIIAAVDEQSKFLHCTLSMEERCAWYGWAHTMVRLKATSPWMVFLGAIRRKARLHPGNSQHLLMALSARELWVLAESPVPCKIRSGKEQMSVAPLDCLIRLFPSARILGKNA